MLNKYFSTFFTTIGALALAWLLPGAVQAQVCDHFEIYDQIQCGFHTGLARKPDGNFTTWGAAGQPNGTSDQLSPTDITPANGYNYTGTPLKASLSNMQRFLLTTTGLYAWGTEAIGLENDMTTSAAFQSVALPVGVSPTDIRHLLGADNAVAIVTYSGEVYINSVENMFRGNGDVNVTGWNAVTTNAVGNPILTGVEHFRIAAACAIAYTSDGTWYTWGPETFLGNGTAVNTTRSRATPMTAPFAGTPKMIALTGSIATDPTYFALNPADKKIYVMGGSADGQAGRGTIVDQLNWVIVQNAAGTGDLTNVKFITASDNQASYPAVGCITEDGDYLLWGANDGEKLGGNTTNILRPRRPDGFTYGTDIPLYAEVGGHVSCYVKACSDRYCYVGHRAEGSMGNGSSASGTQSVYDCVNTGQASICGATSFDAGDAPVSYENGNSAAHLITNCVTNPRIGALEPVPNNGQAAVNVASGADNTGSAGDGAEEDGLATVPHYTAGSGAYSITVSVNNANVSGTILHGWVDWDADGKFSAGEYASVAVPASASAQNATLNWTVSGAVVGNVYLRLRFTSTALSDFAGTSDVDERSIGVANNGEVEDYRLLCTGVGSENETASFTFPVRSCAASPTSIYFFPINAKTEQGFFFNQCGFGPSGWDGTGNMGGLAGADCMCQYQASTAGLPGTYKALLSGSSFNFWTAFPAEYYDRDLKNYNGDIYTGGAHTLNQLLTVDWDAGFDAIYRYTAHGVYISSFNSVTSWDPWIAAYPYNTAQETYHCNNWTSGGLETGTTSGAFFDGAGFGPKPPYYFPGSNQTRLVRCSFGGTIDGILCVQTP